MFNCESINLLYRALCPSRKRLLENWLLHLTLPHLRCRLCVGLKRSLRTGPLRHVDTRSPASAVILDQLLWRLWASSSSRVARRLHIIHYYFWTSNLGNLPTNRKISPLSDLLSEYLGSPIWKSSSHYHTPFCCCRKKYTPEYTAAARKNNLFSYSSLLDPRSSIPTTSSLYLCDGA